MRIAILSVHILHIHEIDTLTMTGTCVHALTSFRQRVASRAPAAFATVRVTSGGDDPALPTAPTSVASLRGVTTRLGQSVAEESTVASARRAAQKGTPAE